MDGKKAVKLCSQCPTCRSTRAGQRVTLRYRVARFLQRRVCPVCEDANRELGRDFQKSPRLDS